MTENENAIDRYFAQDGIAHGLPSPDGKPLTGPSAFKPFVKTFSNGIPEHANRNPSHDHRRAISYAPTAG